MNIVSFTDNIDDYLKEDSVIDYGNEIITQLADTLFREADGEVAYIKRHTNLFCKVALVGFFVTM